MKALVVVTLGMVAATASAQDFSVSQVHQDVPVVRAPEVRPSVEGIVKEIFDEKKPWQLVNPAAPKSYGDGEKTVSYSEKDPGKPKGFILFAVEW